ncbi:HNH endonuclease family protein [Phytoactinopolyspora halotolerans]|uniref:HNH endonuclease family protein n=1 Tax=Phytoactinopolyspora halotolerans TaxID=1981512 RepID=UPI001C204F9C|nr:HNH endonuclease family protein [Phytoactinopolyspora halotolerans]
MSGSLTARVRLCLALVAAALVVAVLALVVDPSATATAPRIPTKTTAQAELNALTVAAERSMSGYSRDKFPHWDTVSGTCNAREQVLKRDGIDVSVNGDCYPTSGRWYSPYDGVTLHSPSDVDIDHVVPLAEAWRSGANSWSTSKRREFANDLYWPQLRAVSAASNRAKGDRDPTAWKPRSAYHCTYAKMWIRTKYQWKLTVQSAEKSELQRMINTC